jgi:hypothetical protein
MFNRPLDVGIHPQTSVEDRGRFGQAVPCDRS